MTHSSRDQMSGNPAGTGFVSRMDSLRRLFYSGMNERELVRLLSKDISALALDPGNPTDWLTVANRSDAASASLRNQAVFWILVGKLRLFANAASDARSAAIHARKLSDDPAVIYWSWQLEREAGFAPPHSASTQVLGAAFEHWIHGEPDGWAMLCTYGDSPRLYLSWGAGITGDITQYDISSAARRFLAEAARVLPQTTRTSRQPSLPVKSDMAVYVLTPAGIHAAMGNEDEIMEGRSPLASLGTAAAELEAQLMMACGVHQQD